MHILVIFVKQHNTIYLIFIDFYTFFCYFYIMDAVHRYNSKERQHYLLGSNYSFRLRPQLLYVGTLTKQPGWHDEPHTHEFAEILFVTEGCGSVKARGQKRVVQAGDLLVYNAGVEHEEASSVDSPMEMIFFALDKVHITDLPPNCLLPSDYDFLFHTEDMYELFKNQLYIMIEEMEKKERFYHEISQNISRTLVMYIFRLLNRATNRSIIKGNNSVYRSALEYINTHYLEKITLEDVANACFVNKYYLSHLFSREQDMTLGQYINQKRFEEAMHLLQNSNRPVSSIATLSGFSDFSYFCRAFKKNVGMTPLQYRKAAEKNKGNTLSK